MHRREFIAYGSGAALAAAFAKAQWEQNAEAQQPTQSIELHMEEIYEELIDGEVVFALAFRDPATRTLRPTLHVTYGSQITLKLVNKTRKPRRFALTGYKANKFPIVAAGETATFTFPALPPGSYIYHDNAEGAQGRVVGLHGALVSRTSNCRTLAGAYTPYLSTKLTPEVSSLFDALGTHAEMLGQPWRHNLAERDFVWLMSQVDPAINRLSELGQTVDLSLPIYRFRPRYFTLNGLSGYDSAHAPGTVPKGYIGEPVLLRTMNAGLATHAPHIHGNHVFCLSDSYSDTGAGYCSDNVYECDTWCVKPLERIDVILPFRKPDEIPMEAWPPKQEPWPLLYPMHCHCEMSQTAGGGNYPQGLVTHWELLGVNRPVV